MALTRHIGDDPLLRAAAADPQRASTSRICRSKTRGRRRASFSRRLSPKSKSTSTSRLSNLNPDVFEVVLTINATAARREKLCFW